MSKDRLDLGSGDESGVWSSIVLVDVELVKLGWLMLSEEGSREVLQSLQLLARQAVVLCTAASETTSTCPSHSPEQVPARQRRGGCQIKS
jgi:hypothetical protein